MGAGQKNGIDSIISSCICVNKVPSKFDISSVILNVCTATFKEKNFFFMLLQTYITDLRGFSDIWVFPLNIETPELCLTFYG